MRVKNSYGIVCIRFNHKKNVKEVLMVKKRTTYSFEKIVSGNYRIEQRELNIIFNKTTIEEKMEILEGDFDKNWKKVYYVVPKEGSRHYVKYYDSREKYYQMHDKEQGAFLRRILENTRSVSTLWDFTKGRRLYDGELDLDSAIREFSEETCISLNNIMFVPQCHKSHTITTNAFTYKSKLFLAIEKNTVESSSNIPNIYLRNKSQVTEIIELKWLTLAELTELDVLKRLAPMVKSFMKEVKKNYNNAKIYNNR